MRISSLLRTSLGALLLFLGIVLLMPGTQKALAEAPCTVPYTFTNGTTAQAPQVNANFAAVVSCLSTIYASDIVPLNAQQATFGGTVNYTFPAAVNVAPGSSGGIGTSSGNNGLWLTSNGANPTNYALNNVATNCGGSGLWQLVNGNTQEDFIGCNGQINTQAGSSMGANVVSGTGNFVAPSPGPLQLCIGTNCLAGSAVIMAATTASAQFNEAVEAVPTPVGTGIVFNPTPGPVPPCYEPGGATCPPSMHSVWGTLNPTTTGVCSSNSNCALNASGASVNLSGNAQFDTPDGAWDIDCSTFQASDFLITTGWVTGTPPTISVITFFNATGTALPNGTGEHVGFYCTGP